MTEAASQGLAPPPRKRLQPLDERMAGSGSPNTPYLNLQTNVNSPRFQLFSTSPVKSSRRAWFVRASNVFVNLYTKKTCVRTTQRDRVSDGMAIADTRPSHESPRRVQIREKANEKNRSFGGNSAPGPGIAQANPKKRRNTFVELTAFSPIEPARIEALGWVI